MQSGFYPVQTGFYPVQTGFYPVQAGFYPVHPVVSDISLIKPIIYNGYKLF